MSLRGVGRVDQCNVPAAHAETLRRPRVLRCAPLPPRSSTARPRPQQNRRDRSDSGGSRFVLSASGPQRLPAVRAHVAQHRLELSLGTCAHMPAGPAAGPAHAVATWHGTACMLGAHVLKEPRGRAFTRLGSGCMQIRERGRLRCAPLGWHSGFEGFEQVFGGKRARAHAHIAASWASGRTRHADESHSSGSSALARAVARRHRPSPVPPKAPGSAKAAEAPAI